MDTADEFEGTDETGLIRVVVDRSGAVTDVAVAPRWRDGVPQSELGDALCAAANQALHNRLVDQAEHIDLEPELPVTPRQDARDAGADPSSPVARELRDEIAGLLVFLERDLEAYRSQLAEAAETTASAFGEREAIEVTMTHSAVTHVAVHPTWVKSARHTDVRAEARGAFAAAAARLAAADPRAVTPPASILRLRELAGDPRSLSRELGLS